MHRSNRGRVGLVLAMIVAFFAAILVPAQSASATTVYDNVYNCAKTDGTDTVWVGYCSGLWFAGTPGDRTAKMYLDLVTVADSGYRNTEIKSVASTDGRKKVYEWRCQYDNGTTSGLIATTTVGGGLANTFTWANGYNPCTGYKGVNVSIDATYGNYTYVSVIQINAPVDYYPHAWRGYQRTA
jgi:hypothetical protein